MNGGWGLKLAMGAGFAFLYIPILLVVVFSFNESRLVTVWGGFSTRWYGEVLNNRAMMNGLWLSLQIGALAATLATVMGTLAGFALSRFGSFRGRTLFAAATAAPLVMPEVVTGLSLLLLFVAMEQALGWPAGRGALTVTIAHATFGMAFVAVVVQSRLAGFDRSLEEAAMDLGAAPFTVFRTVTLPLIAPGVASGWLLAFTLSIDDVVVASFTTGPAATTLPMVVFSSVRLGVSPEINALATLILLVVGSGVVLAGVLAAKSARQDPSAR